MSKIVGIEAALQTSFPGYFDMSLVEIDEYLSSLSHEDLLYPDEALPFSPLTDLDNSQQDLNMHTSVVHDALITAKHETIPSTCQSTPTPSVPLHCALTNDGHTTPATEEFQEILQSISLLKPDLPSATSPRTRVTNEKNGSITRRGTRKKRTKRRDQSGTHRSKMGSERFPGIESIDCTNVYKTCAATVYFQTNKT